MPSPVAPTISRTNRDRPDAERLADSSTAWERRLHGDRQHRASRRSTSAPTMIFMALAAHHSELRLPLSLFTICSVRSGRISSTTATRRGPMCSITAADRRIRSGDWCCGSRATTTRRSTPVRRVVHGAAADQFLAGPRRSTGARGGCTCLSMIRRPRRRQRRGSRRRTGHVLNGARRLRDAGGADADAVRSQADRYVTACAGGCAGNCASHGSAHR